MSKKIKDCFCTGVLGILIGTLISLTIKELDSFHKFVFIALVILITLLIAYVLVTDLDKRLDNAYQRGIFQGRKFPYHPNCRYTINPNENEK